MVRIAEKSGGPSQKGSLGVQVISRAAEIVRALEGRDDGLSLGQLSKIVGLPRSTVQRIVAALANEAFVIGASPTARVRLGPALVRIAHSVRFEIADIARPYLQDLSQRTGETVDLALLSGSKAVFVDQVQGSQRLRAVSAVGVSFPLASTANGKALLAALEPDALRKLKPQLHLNRTSWPKLEAELDEVRRNGVAYDREQNSAGISAIGAAIAGPRGELAAISIPAPSSRFAENEAELTVALLECRSRLQEILSAGGMVANR